MLVSLADRQTSDKPRVNPLRSTATAEHYKWGNGCDGWVLLMNNDFSVIEEAMPPGTAEISHYHNDTRQFFYMLSGELIVTMADDSHTLPALSGLEVAPRVPHRVQNCGREVAKFLVISVPPSRNDRINLEAPAQASA